jgi:uncharacterized protein (TIGR01777 family)
MIHAMLNKQRGIMHILITGGSGLIGSAYIKAHPEHHFLCLTHQRSDFPAHCTLVGLLDQITPSTQIDAIINLAGAPIDQRWSQKNKDTIQNSRFQTTQAIIDLIKKLEKKPKQLISASAVGYYLSTNSFSHQLCATWENIALQANTLNVKTNILRLAAVLSPNQGLLKKLKLPYQLGLAGHLGPGTQTMNWIHLTDVINAIDHLLGHEQAGCFDLVAPEIVTQAVFASSYAKSLGRPAFFMIPGWYIKCLFGQMGEELLLSSNTQNALSLLATGFRFQYPKLKDVFK